jgi:TonB family protein
MLKLLPQPFVPTRARAAACLAAALAALISFSLPIAAQQSPEPKTTAPRLIQKVEPEYSKEAQDARLEGTVVVSVEVGTDGKAHEGRIEKSLGMGLDEKALEAVQLWTFEPGTRNGEPVAVRATIQMNFRLK